VFFQRPATTGWNFRMYNGNGSGLGWDLTGGTSTLNQWSHVVATWNGSAAQLYDNGVLVASTNGSTANGVYNPNTTIPLTVGTLEDQTSPFDGAVDEVAFYGTALSSAAILNHFNTMATNPGAYQGLVRSDGALLQLSMPEPSGIMVLLGGSVLLLRGRRRQQRPS
jgi:hypothetical protein